MISLLETRALILMAANANCVVKWSCFSELAINVWNWLSDGVDFSCVCILKLKALSSVLIYR